MPADEPTVSLDLEAEKELEVVLRQLARLAVERPGGVTIEELSHNLGREEFRGVRELLERGRMAVIDGVGDRRRSALIERVHEDIDAYWRARYVPTPAGFEFQERRKT